MKRVREKRLERERETATNTLLTSQLTMTSAAVQPGSAVVPGTNKDKRKTSPPAEVSKGLDGI